MVVQLGEFIHQHKHTWRHFRRFPAKDFTQPLADLVTNRTAMDVVEHHRCTAAVRRGPSRWFGLDLIWPKSGKSKFASGNARTGEKSVKHHAAGCAVAFEIRLSLDARFDAFRR